MMLAAIVNTLMGALAISAIAIGAAIFAVGPHATAEFFSIAFNFLGSEQFYTGGLESTNSDSEMRFMSVFWAGFGIWILSKLQAGALRRTWVTVALALFWIGGLGRLLSFSQTGHWPDSLFMVLMWIELLAPPIIFVLHIFSRPRKIEEPL